MWFVRWVFTEWLSFPFVPIRTLWWLTISLNRSFKWIGIWIHCNYIIKSSRSKCQATFSGLLNGKLNAHKRSGFNFKALDVAVTSSRLVETDRQTFTIWNIADRNWIAIIVNLLFHRSHFFLCCCYFMRCGWVVAMFVNSTAPRCDRLPWSCVCYWIQKWRRRKLYSSSIKAIYPSTCRRNKIWLWSTCDYYFLFMYQ